jgi:hypothetical protein
MRLRNLYLQKDLYHCFSRHGGITTVEMTHARIPNRDVLDGFCSDKTSYNSSKIIYKHEKSMTERIVSDRNIVLQFLGNKLDDADAWLQTLKDNGIEASGTLVKTAAASSTQTAVPA